MATPPFVDNPTPILPYPPSPFLAKLFRPTLLNIPKTFNCETGYMSNVKFRPTTKSNTRKILST